MPARPVTHPSAEALKAFALGKMDDTSAAALMAHLEQCEDCRKGVSALSGDDFLKRLRQAHTPSSTPAPAKTLGGVAPGVKLPGKPTTVYNLPPELADHPQYDVLRELGHGGMGVVYLAQNKLMDRLEVLKVVNKRLLDHSGSTERFLREIRSAAKLNHVNVVAAYSVLQAGELLAFAMEYVEGQDLAALVKSQGPLPVAHACFYVQQAATGLQHAFEKGMVHRDIKPQNLILAREGRKHILKVLDFGLAKATREKTDDPGLTGEGQMLGTPDYIAPEQIIDATNADIRADIYSLGCTLYYLLSGNTPFKRKNLYETLQAHHSAEARPLNLARPEVPKELAAVVQKMMAKEPAKRYQTPLEVVQALGVFVKQAPRAGTAKSEQSLTPAAGVKPASPKREESSAPGWDSLTTGGVTSAESSRSKVVRQRRSSRAKANSRKGWWIGGGVAVGLLALGLLGMWAAGGLFKVKTQNGTIVMENVPADVEITVDGERVTIQSREGKTVVISVTAGKKHRLLVKKEGFKVFGEEVEIDAGGRRPPIVVRLEPQPQPDKPAVDPRPAPDKPAPVAEGAGEKQGFVSLFNGKDLTGWKAPPQQPGKWRVENGVLSGAGPLSNLFTERGDYKDFHLRVEARINDGGNSGVFFRSDFSPGFPKTYEAQINSTHRDVNKTGSLYAGGAAVSVRQSPVPPGEWFTMEVIVEDNHIVIKVNGKTTADYTDETRRFTSGHLGLQQHNPKTIAEFRKIEIKELSPPPADAAGKVNLPKLYLYDLKEFDLEVLEGRFRNGYDANGVKVKGERYKKGLWMHPFPDRPSSVKYRLDGLNAVFFEAKVALNDSVPDGSASPLTFQVFGDDKVLWTSNPVRFAHQSQDCRVKVEGIHVLELRVACEKDHRSAIAVWADPCLLAAKKDRVDLAPNRNDAWVRKVRGLPAEEQVKEVVAELKRRNPNFDGKITPEIRNDVVVGLTFLVDNVTDISPLRALSQLKSLTCIGSLPHEGKLADLTPLQGMELTILDCSCTRVADLTPLKGMPLRRLTLWAAPLADLTPLKGMALDVLNLAAVPVVDLTPLRGMPLTKLYLNGSKVKDLGPLKGLPLQYLHLGGTAVDDLSPLTGMPLETLICCETKIHDLSPLATTKLVSLDCYGSPVKDVSPLKGLKMTVLCLHYTQVPNIAALKGMPLTFLNLQGIPVTDLSPLKGMPLTALNCADTRIDDLSPLKETPLQEISINKPKRGDKAILDSIKTLEKINGRPKAEFWKDPR